MMPYADPKKMREWRLAHPDTRQDHQRKRRGLYRRQGGDPLDAEYSQILPARYVVKASCGAFVTQRRPRVRCLKCWTWEYAIPGAKKCDCCKGTGWHGKKEQPMKLRGFSNPPKPMEFR